MIVIHQGKYWQSAGPCLKSSAADHSAPLAGEKTHTESPQHRWHWPNHTPPTAASGTNQSLRGKAGQEVNKQTITHMEKVRVACILTQRSLFGFLSGGVVIV